MPLVLVTVKPGMFDDADEKKFARAIKEVVSTVLSCEDEGGQLEAGDIEVRFSDVGPRHYGASPLAIEIFANDFPSRRASIQERTARIAMVLRAVPVMPRELIGNTSFVWVLLCPAGFARL